MSHGMRWVGLDAARVLRAVMLDAEGQGLTRGVWDVDRDGIGSASGADHGGVARYRDGRGVARSDRAGGSPGRAQVPGAV